MGTVGSTARPAFPAADDDAPYHYRSQNGELIFLDLKRRRLSRHDDEDGGEGGPQCRSVDEVVLRRRQSRCSTNSSSQSDTSSSSSTERATPRQVLPFDAADRPDFGYLERVLQEYERLATRQRSLRKLSSYGGRSSSSAVWSSSFSFDDPGPLQRFDLRQCPALADVVARVEKEGGGGGVHDHLVGGAAGKAAAAAIARRRGAAGAGGSASGEGPGLAHPGRSLRSVLSLPAMASLLMAWRGRPAAGGGSRAVTFWALIRRFCFKYHGIPDDLRARAWDLIGEALGVNYDERFFRLLCNGAWVEECYREQIDRDVACTSFGGGESLGEEARQGMRRVLLAYATYNTRVGYVPGMSWLVGMMFRSGLDEQCAFRLFFTLMEAYGLAELYAHDCQGFKECFSLLDSLLAARLKRLHKHLHKADISLESLAQSWLLTLFSSSPMEASLVARFWDVVLLAGCLQREHLRAAAQTSIVHFVFRLLQRSERMLLQQPDQQAIARLLGCPTASSHAAEDGPVPPLCRRRSSFSSSCSSLTQLPAFGPSSFFPTTPAELFALLQPDRASQQIAHSLQAGLLRPRYRARSHKTCIPPSSFSTTLGGGGEAAANGCPGSNFTSIAAPHSAAVTHSHPTSSDKRPLSSVAGFFKGGDSSESRRSSESSPPQPGRSSHQQPQPQQQDARGIVGGSNSHSTPRWLPVLGRRTVSSTINEEE